MGSKSSPLFILQLHQGLNSPKFKGIAIFTRMHQLFFQNALTKEICFCYIKHTTKTYFCYNIHIFIIIYGDAKKILMEICFCYKNISILILSNIITEIAYLILYLDSFNFINLKFKNKIIFKISFIETYYHKYKKKSSKIKKINKRCFKNNNIKNNKISEIYLFLFYPKSQH